MTAKYRRVRVVGSIYHKQIEFPEKSLHIFVYVEKGKGY